MNGSNTSLEKLLAGVFLSFGENNLDFLFLLIFAGFNFNAPLPCPQPLYGDVLRQ
jgi:hypothetical protein